MTVNRTVAPAAPGTGVALTALGLSALLAVMDGTVVAVALEPLAGTFDTTLSTVVWLAVVYLLAAATTLPLLAWASARYGGRTVYLAGLALFVVGSALCAAAPSIGWLIAFRVVQGLGGGLLEPSSLALAARMARPQTVGKVLGIMSMVINVAPVAGPILGSALATGGHWRWIFLINIPLGALVFAAALAFVPADRPDPAAARPAADVRGLALLTIGYVTVLFGLSRTAQPGAIWPTLVAVPVGLALLVAYVRHALAGTRPAALDLRLLRRPGFGASLAVMGLVGYVMYSLMAALPILGAQRHGLHGAAQGVLVCALGAGLMVSMSVGGRVSDRTGPRPLVRAGAAVTAGLLVVLALTHDALPLPVAFTLLVLLGLSFGATASPTFASGYRVLPAAEQPAGTVALFRSVQLAASLGVTVRGILRTSSGGLTMLFALLALAAAGMLVLSRALPGQPTVPSRDHALMGME